MSDPQDVAANPDDYFGYQPAEYAGPERVTPLEEPVTSPSGEVVTENRSGEALHQYAPMEYRPVQPADAGTAIVDAERAEQQHEHSSAGATDDGPYDLHTFLPGHYDIEVFWRWVGGMSNELTNRHADGWSRIASLLRVASLTLRGRADVLAQTWHGRTGTIFLEWIGATLYSLDQWADVATENASGLRMIADAIQVAQDELGPLYTHYRAVLAVFNEVGSLVPFINPEHEGWTPPTGLVPELGEVVDLDGYVETGDSRGMRVDSVDDILLRYHQRAADIVEPLANEYVNVHYAKLDQGRMFAGPTNAAGAGQFASTLALNLGLQIDGLADIGSAPGAPGLGGVAPTDFSVPGGALAGGGVPGAGLPGGLPGGALAGLAPFSAAGLPGGLPAQAFPQGDAGLLAAGLPAALAGQSALATQPALAGLAGLPAQQAALDAQRRQQAAQAVQQSAAAGQQQAGLATQQADQAARQVAQAAAALRGPSGQPPVGAGAARSTPEIALPGATLPATTPAGTAVPGVTLPEGLPEVTLPGATSPGSGLPGSGLPGSGLPGSGLPGSGLPGSGLPGAASTGVGPPSVTLPGAGSLPPGTLAPGALAPGMLAPDVPGTTGLTGAPALGGAGATPAGGAMMPPPPPPMMPPMAPGQGQGQGQNGAQRAGGPLRGAMPGQPPAAPPSMFVPPGRVTQPGRTPTTPQRIAPALSGTAQPARSPRATGLRGAAGLPAAPRSEPATQRDPAGAPETVPVPGEHDRELWTVKKPKGLVQSAAPHRPAQHGKPIGSPG